MTTLKPLLFLTLISLAATAQELPNYVPQNGLVGWYPLSKSAGLTDLSRRAPSGVPASAGNLMFAMDRFGNENGALHFEKDIPVIQFPLPSPVTFSIGLWAKTSSAGISDQTLLRVGSATDKTLKIMYDPVSLYWTFALGNDSAQLVISRADPLFKQGWHLMTATFDGRTMMLYVDGNLEGTRDLNAASIEKFNRGMDVANQHLMLGRPPGRPEYPFYGDVQDFFIYNRVLASPEIRKLYEANIGEASSLQRSNLRIGFIEQDHLLCYFPQIESTAKPKAAAAINRALQISSFRAANTSKDVHVANRGMSMDKWWYQIEMPTDRLLTVRLSKTVIDWSRRDSPSLEYHFCYWFDAITGDMIDPGSIFSDAGKGAMLPKVKTALSASLEANGSCTDSVSSYWGRSEIRMTASPFNKAFTFEMSDCYKLEFGEDVNFYEGTVQFQGIVKNLSPIGQYYLGNGQQQPITNVTHSWTFVLGENIHVTMLLREKAGRVVGEEIYDNYGQVIPMAGTFSNGVLAVSELDPKGTPVATYQGNLSGRKITGTWTKADHSRTFPFTATIAAENP